MNYRRAHEAGGIFFFTVNLENRQSTLLVDQVHLLHKAIRQVRETYYFQIIAMVVLPDHLHTIWQLPEGDSNFALRWSLIKAKFSRTIPKTESTNKSRKTKRERGIWQRRYWEHQIRNEDDLEKHVAYIHYNPVKHGHAKHPIDWPYSSIHRYVSDGTIDKNWGGVGT